MRCLGEGGAASAAAPPGRDNTTLRIALGIGACVGRRAGSGGTCLALDDFAGRSALGAQHGADDDNDCLERGGGKDGASILPVVCFLVFTLDVLSWCFASNHDPDACAGGAAGKRRCPCLLLVAHDCSICT